MRKYRANRSGKGFEVAQEDSVTFATEDELRTYLKRQTQELETIHQQKQRLSEMEAALIVHIEQVRSLLPTE